MDSNQYILVAGGLGYIGSHVSLELLKCHYNVIIVDNLHNSHINTLDHIRQMAQDIKQNQLVFQQIDLLDQVELSKLFENYNIVAVIGLAGLKSVSDSILNPTQYYQTNLNIITNLLDIMNKFQCHQFIFSSSATVYGNNDIMPITEHQQIGHKITNPYGYSKYLIELILSDLCQYSNLWTITSLRYFNPAGNCTNGLLSDHPKLPQMNIMPAIIKAQTTGEPFNIFGNDYETKDGTAARDYIHVSDLAKAHVLALSHNNIGYHYYNVGLGYPITVKELISTFEKVNNVKILTMVKPNRPGDIPVCYADTTKIKAELGWTPKYNLSDIVRDSAVNLC